ncbi:MAG: helix-turn-helix domain-containing protein [bacterium]
MSTRRPKSQAERAHAFGARIRALRRSQQLTQRQVAEPLPMSPGNLSRLENGEHGPPSDEVIAKLADVLNADSDELFRLAGRDVGGASFERQVLSELRGLRRDMREVKAAVTGKRRKS